MTWSSEQKEGREAGAQTEEAAMTAAITRAFRAIDEEVVGSVCALQKLLTDCAALLFYMAHCARLRALHIPSWHIDAVRESEPARLNFQVAELPI